MPCRGCRCCTPLLTCCLTSQQATRRALRLSSGNWSLYGGQPAYWLNQLPERPTACVVIDGMFFTVNPAFTNHRNILERASTTQKLYSICLFDNTEHRLFFAHSYVRCLFKVLRACWLKDGQLSYIPGLNAGVLRKVWQALAALE